MYIVIDLVMSFDPNHDGTITFEEFVHLMWQIENNKDNTSEDQQQRIKREFGNMLPKSGVYFLPDARVLDFLK